MPTHRERHAKRAAQRDDAESADDVRLDKWLWAARFFKTRALAHAAIESGKIKHDGERCKPSHTVRKGERYEISREGLIWNIEVRELSDRRGSGTVAAQLYIEDEASINARLESIARRKATLLSSPYGRGRPTKRQRRKIEDFLAEP